MHRIVLFCLCLLTSRMLYAQQAKASIPKSTEKQRADKIDYSAPGAPMPALKILLYKDSSRQKLPPQLDKKFLTNDDFRNGAYSLFMIFNPNCTHCMEVTTMIENEIASFNHSRFTLVTDPAVASYMHTFYRVVHLNDFPAFNIGYDSSGFIRNVFLYQSLPQINIYDSNQVLVRTFTSTIKIDSLRPYIR